MITQRRNDATVSAISWELAVSEIIARITKVAGQAGTHKRWAGLGTPVLRPVDVRYDIPDPALRALHEHRVDPDRVLSAPDRQRRAWHSWQYDLRTAELEALLREHRAGAHEGAERGAR